MQISEVPCEDVAPKQNKNGFDKMSISCSPVSDIMMGLYQRQMIIMVIIY